MIQRTVRKAIEESLLHKPVTLVTGLRQVGKTTLCKAIGDERGFGYVSLVECKTGISYGAEDAKAFRKMRRSGFEIGPSCIICMTNTGYPVAENVYALPIASI